jgi:hypothetical protein
MTSSFKTIEPQKMIKRYFAMERKSIPAKPNPPDDIK